jgi:hypothetical protein
MTELAADRAEKIKIEEMLLPDDCFDITADEEKHEHAGSELEDARVQKHRAKKLPGIRLIDPAVTQAEIFRDHRWLVNLQELLSDEGSEIESEKSSENEALAWPPTRRGRRCLSTGQAHGAKLSQTFSLVIEKARLRAEARASSSGEDGRNGSAATAGLSMLLRRSVQSAPNSTPRNA